MSRMLAIAIGLHATIMVDVVVCYSRTDEDRLKDLLRASPQSAAMHFILFS